MMSRYFFMKKSEIMMILFKKLYYSKTYFQHVILYTVQNKIRQESIYSAKKTFIQFDCKIIFINEYYYKKSWRFSLLWVCSFFIRIMLPSKVYTKAVQPLYFLEQSHRSVNPLLSDKQNIQSSNKSCL